MTTKTTKRLGQLDNCSIKMTDGFLKMMNSTEMKFNKLVLMTGTNGSGKSVLLKLSWAVSTILNNILMIDFHKIIGMDIKLMTKFILDNTFTNQDMTGDIYFDFTCGSTILIKLDKGDVIDVISTHNIDIEPGSQPIFMSANNRLFTAIISYLKFKKALGINYGMDKFTDSDMNKLCDMYRLYDIYYNELLFKKIDDKGLSALLPNMKLGEFPTRSAEFSKKFDLPFIINDIQMDYSNSDILFTDDKNITKSLGSLSNGEQSLINMCIANT